MNVYTIVGESGVRSRFDVAEPPGIAPLIGRAADLAAIRDAWRQVEAGNGRSIVICAEPGIGKSRLILAAKQSLAGSAHAVLASRCSPDAQNTELFAIADLLTRIFRFGRKSTPAQQWDRIATVLARYRSLPPDAVALFASILSIPPPPGTRPLDLSPKDQRRLVFEALIAWLLEEAEERPQLLVIEDLHWADPTTLELLGLITKAIDTSRILCLFTTRPDNSPSWVSNPGLSEIDLTHLSRDDSEALAVAVAGDSVLPKAVLREIVAKTDGIPLFVEEVTRSFIEADRSPVRDPALERDGPGGDLGIPSSLQSSLMARLDRLGRAKEVAQTAAVLGRDVPLDLLEAVSSLEGDELLGELAVLEGAQLLYRHDTATGPTYTFRHALIREIAYDSVLRSVRQRQHHLAALTLEERFPEVIETQPELLARHYRLAGVYEPAARYFLRAGKRALARSALVEAVAHFSAGIQLLDGARAIGTPLELSLQLGLGGALLSSEGYAKPEVKRSFTRAYALGSESGDVSALFPATFGLWLYDFTGGRLDQALDSTQRLLQIAEQTGEGPLRVEGLLVEALTLLASGELVNARSSFEEGFALHDPTAARSLSRGARSDASYRSCFAVDLWLLGLLDTAADVGARGLELAEGYGDAYTLGIVLGWQGMLELLRGDDRAALATGVRGVAICEANDMAFWRMGSALVVAAAAEPAERIEAIPRELATYHAAGAHFAETLFMLRLVEAHRDLGQTDDALRVLAETRAAAEATGERWLEPDVLRLEGELLLATDPVAGEDRLRHAIDLARRQESLTLRLRAATSLARLLRDRERADEAEAELRPVVDAFEEGLESTELLEARSLLARP